MKWWLPPNKPLAPQDGPAAGAVWLVGAGPGDPDLLTVRAVRAITRADVIVYDQLVDSRVLGYARAGAERLFVGKRSGHHTLPQDGINALLLNRARRGLKVVRLKGGDPGIFGRAGEEAEYLTRHGIAVKIVPGITAALGCAASLGIPLTHRGIARTVHLATGHCREGEPLDLDWRSLAGARGTIVLYMGRKNLEDLATNLIAAGLAPDTPAVAIENGTLPTEQCCYAIVATLPETAQSLPGEGPTMIIIGQVVACAQAFSSQMIPADSAA